MHTVRSGNVSKWGSKQRYRMGGPAVERFCAMHNIDAQVVRIFSDPFDDGSRESSTVNAQMNHWSMRLVRSEGPSRDIRDDMPSMAMFLGTGKATYNGFFDTEFTALPTAGCAIEALLADFDSVRGYDGMTPWRDRAENLGDRPDSMRMFIEWERIAVQTRQLKEFMDDLWADLLVAHSNDEGGWEFDDDE